jgi:hypothetical protein
MFPHLGDNRAWREFRYSRAKLPGLDNTQMSHWIGEVGTEIGEMESPTVSKNRIEQMLSRLRSAVVEDKHLYNPGQHEGRAWMAQQTLSELFSKVEQGEDLKKVAQTLRERLRKEAELYDTLILDAQAEKLTRALEHFRKLDQVVANTTNKNLLNTVIKLLPVEERKTIEESYRRLEKETDEYNKRYKEELKKKEKERPADLPQAPRLERSALLRDELLKDVETLLGNNQKEAEKARKNLPEERISPVPLVRGQKPPLYENREQLQLALMLLDLAALDERAAVRNQLDPEKKSGRTVSELITELKSAFRGAPFEQDLEEIGRDLRGRDVDLGPKRLAFIFSDDPNLLWQSGKYPLGNGSCQHYADGSMAGALMGYVGDPHIKVLYTVNINALSKESQSKIDEIGFGAALESLPREELLKASVARTIVKYGHSKERGPVVVLEPTYTTVNKSDTSHDRAIELFMLEYVTKPMGVSLARVGSGETVTIQASLSPGGQYEDGPNGNAGNGGMGVRQGRYSLSVRTIQEPQELSEKEKRQLERMRRSSPPAYLH